MRANLPLLVLMGLALCGPFALVARAQSALAESAVTGAVTTLLQLTALLTPPPPVSPEASDLAEASLSFAVEPAAAAAAAPSKGRRASPPGATRAQPQAVFVGASSVLQLANSSAQPRGRFVARTSEHPAGLRLHGVGALGIGVQDGDILIEAMGDTPRSSGQVIGAIIQARAERARYLSGTLWRRGHTFRITVEQPYAGPA